MKQAEELKQAIMDKLGINLKLEEAILLLEVEQDLRTIVGQAHTIKDRKEGIDAALLGARWCTVGTEYQCTRLHDICETYEMYIYLHYCVDESSLWVANKMVDGDNFMEVGMAVGGPKAGG